MRKRGIRVVIGGDYGFACTPQGANARDIEHFVNLFGYSPSEALACATRVGAELMGLGHELGQVREGYLADLLLVDGDPLADVSILQRQERLVAIMQNGNFHKLDRDALARRQGRTADRPKLKPFSMRFGKRLLEMPVPIRTARASHSLTRSRCSHRYSETHTA